MKHLGFGFDFIRYLDSEQLAGIGGLPPSAPGIALAQDTPGFIQRMRERGFSPADIKAISWDNFARVWSRATG